MINAVGALLDSSSTKSFRHDPAPIVIGPSTMAAAAANSSSDGEPPE
jgi:hypothetical protein